MEQFNDRFNIILQEFVKDSHGKDLRIIVVGGKVIGAMKRESVDGDLYKMLHEVVDKTSRT